jgi:hypothetical protein
MINGSTDNTWFGLNVQTDTGWDYFEFANGSVGTSWVQLNGSVTPTWSGALIQAFFVVGSDGTSELLVDNAELELPQTATPVGPIPGTWRREPQ